MELYLVRHAIAVPADGLEDDARPLSPKGERRFRKVARGLGRLGVRFAWLFHSPKLRAVQTADLLMDLVDGESEVTPALAEPPTEALFDLLAGFGPEDGVALVGHEPWLGELGSWLVFANPAGGALVLKKGGVARLEGEARPGGMRLLALLPPKVLRKL